MQELAKELIKSLDIYQIWFIVIILGLSFIFLILALIFLSYKRGLKIPFSSDYLIDPPIKKNQKDARPNNFEVSREIHLDKKFLGSIGFYKDLVFFRFFGLYWNSSTAITKDLLDIFDQEFYPPSFLSDAQKEEIECYLILEDCNIQSKLLSKIREGAKRWRHVYVIASKTQINNQELDFLLAENGAPANIFVISRSKSF